MMKMNIYLNSEEEKALHLRADDKSSHAIARECVLPLSGMGMFMQGIRRKTGIRDTKDAGEVRDYLSRYADAIKKAHLMTPQRRAVLEKVLDNCTPQGICYTMHLPLEHYGIFMEGLLAEAAIFSRDEAAQKTQIRLYLSIFHREHARKPSPGQFEMLRMIAEDRPLIEIADLLNIPLKYVKAEIRSACYMLGLTARGRNTQRQLVRAFLAHRDHSAITMDDPAF